MRNGKGEPEGRWGYTAPYPPTLLDGGFGLL